MERVTIIRKNEKREAYLLNLGLKVFKTTNFRVLHDLEMYLKNSRFLLLIIILNNSTPLKTLQRGNIQQLLYKSVNNVHEQICGLLLAVDIGTMIIQESIF